ncbi:proteophosphoglycan-related [Abeliophyllum distichum]|uniref:Proteophosphoglycan-related n=1 Tax=Abeliophyllum distichum TaxID=126358 RepID=A0ABD1QMI5_9LAMI
MARSNKYASLNFNDIYDKKLNNNNNQTSSNNSSAKSFSSSGASFANPNKTIISNSRIHGHMLVLSRPSPKPISIPVKPSIEQQENKEKGSVVCSVTPPDQARSDPEPDLISLRPQGRTGSAPAISSSPLPSPVSPLLSPLKTNRFVPPHLRPGFVGKQEKPGPEIVKSGPPGGFKGRQDFGGHRPALVQDLGHYGSSPNRFGEDGRPKSGGGYERMRRGGEPADLNRPGSSGNRPSSSG